MWGMGLNGMGLGRMGRAGMGCTVISHRPLPPSLPPPFAARIGIVTPTRRSLEDVQGRGSANSVVGRGSSNASTPVKGRINGYNNGSPSPLSSRGSRGSQGSVNNHNQSPSHSISPTRTRRGHNSNVNGSNTANGSNTEYSHSITPMSTPSRIAPGTCSTVVLVVLVLSSINTRTRQAQL